MKTPEEIRRLPNLLIAQTGGAAAEEKKYGDEYLADLAAADDSDLPF